MDINAIMAELAQYIRIQEEENIRIGELIYLILDGMRYLTS